jgi:predicted transglutaminase-like cysteine proteinase
MTKVFKSIILSILAVVIFSSCDISPLANGPTWRDLQFANINQAFNYVANNISYKKDIDNYGYNDYWASPDETYNKKTGDCEDYCILFMAIVNNNFSIKMILLNNGLGHALVHYGNDYYDLTVNKITKKIETADKYEEIEYDTVMILATTTHNKK